MKFLIKQIKFWSYLNYHILQFLFLYFNIFRNYKIIKIYLFPIKLLILVFKCIAMVIFDLYSRKGQKVSNHKISNFKWQNWRNLGKYRIKCSTCSPMKKVHSSHIRETCWISTYPLRRSTFFEIPRPKIVELCVRNTKGPHLAATICDRCQCLYQCAIKEFTKIINNFLNNHLYEKVQ